MDLGGFGGFGRRGVGGVGVGGVVWGGVGVALRCVLLASRCVCFYSASASRGICVRVWHNGICGGGGGGGAGREGGSQGKAVRDLLRGGMLIIYRTGGPDRRERESG